MAVLRAKGFDGASMNDLAEATGLKKASLYHRFPGGKKEIAEAVLAFTRQWGQAHIWQVLTDETIAPKERLTTALQNIRNLYNDGDSICILRALSMDSSLPFFDLQIRQNFQTWLTAFTKLGEDLGYPLDKAKPMALESLMLIQGSLVLTKGMDQRSPFQYALKLIEQKYIS